MSGDWGVVTLPKGKTKVTTGATLNYGIAASSRHQAEARALIR